MGDYSDERRKTLIVVRRAPYGSSLSRASLDAALALAAFDQRVDILFMGDGVLHLLPDQMSSEIGAKNVGKLLASLPLYDIDSIHLDSNAADQYQIDTAHLPLTAHRLDNAGITLLLAEYDHLLGF